MRERSEPAATANKQADCSLFFACFPDRETAERIHRLALAVCAELGLARKPKAAERLHVTLHHLGNHKGLPARIVSAAKAAADDVIFPAFDTQFDRLSSFPGSRHNRPVILRGGDLAQLRELQERLGESLTVHGLDPFRDRDYTPHLTLLYNNRRVPDASAPLVAWRVTEFVLMQSLRGQGRYVELGRWPLGPP